VLVLLAPSPDSVQLARRAVTAALEELNREDLVDDAAVIVSELVGNTVMHAGTEITLSVNAFEAGIRVRVGDRSLILPRWIPAAATATSGRGLLLVQRLAGTWGVEPLGDHGKVVWAQIDQPALDTPQDADADLLDLWGAEPWPSHHLPDAGIEVAVEVDVQAMLDSRAHTDELVRDLQLTLLAGRSETTPDIVALARRVELANNDFHEPRRQMYNQTVSAARHHHTETTLHLLLHAADAGAATRWLAALDEADELPPPACCSCRRRAAPAAVPPADDSVPAAVHRLDRAAAGSRRPRRLHRHLTGRSPGRSATACAGQGADARGPGHTAPGRSFRATPASPPGRHACGRARR